MKTYKKSNLTYVNGYIMNGDEIVQIDNEIVIQANQLEADVQRASFNQKRKAAIDAVKLAADTKFSFKSERKRPVIQANTPTLDEMVEKSIDLMDELDALKGAERANEYFRQIVELVEFVQDDFVVECPAQAAQERFDLPTLGNPLEWDKDKLSDAVCGMFEE